MSSSESGSATGGAGGASSGGVGGAACHPGDAKVMLAAGKPGPTALAIDEAFAYFWVSGELSCESSGVLGRVPKAGGAVEELGHTVQAVTALAVDEERLYWTDDPVNKCTLPDDPGYLLYAMPKAGGEPVALQIPGGAQSAVSLVLDSARLYYAAGAQPVFSVTKDGASLEKWMTPGWPPSDVGVDATHLFVLGPTALSSIALDPKGNPVTLLSVSDALRGLALDSDRLYFGGWGACEGEECQFETGALRSLGKDGVGPPALVAQRPDRRPFKVAVDGEQLYWTERSSPQAAASGAVVRVGKAGGAVTEIAQAQGPADVAVDGDCVYWTEEATGAVWRAPR